MQIIEEGDQRGSNTRTSSKSIECHPLPQENLSHGTSYSCYMCNRRNLGPFGQMPLNPTFDGKNRDTCWAAY